MNENHIFVDTNVLVGAFSGRETDRNCLDYLTSLKGKRLFVSALSMAQLVSVFQKKKDNAEIRSIVEWVMAKRFNIISFTEADLRESLKETGADIEDNIQHVIGKKLKCMIFVTNNVKDYRRFPDIDVIRPDSIRASVNK